MCVFSAQEKEVTIKDPRTGKNQVVVVKVWNETVANLTLMALGSSAPEIMLSVIEIWAKGFEVINNCYCYDWSKLVQIALNVSKPAGTYLQTPLRLPEFFPIGD